MDVSRHIQYTHKPKDVLHSSGQVRVSNCSVNIPLSQTSEIVMTQTGQVSAGPQANIRC